MIYTKGGHMIHIQMKKLRETAKLNVSDHPIIKRDIAWATMALEVIDELLATIDSVLRDEVNAKEDARSLLGALQE